MDLGFYCTYFDIIKKNAYLETEIKDLRRKTNNQEQDIEYLKTKMALMPTDRTVAPETDEEKWARYNKKTKDMSEKMVIDLTDLKNILLNIQRG